MVLVMLLVAGLASAKAVSQQVTEAVLTVQRCVRAISAAVFCLAGIWVSPAKSFGIGRVHVRRRVPFGALSTSSSH